MGEAKAVICRDCEEYVDIQKLFFPHHRAAHNTKGWFEEAFRNDWKREHLYNMMAFMDKHKGHNLALTGEYGGAQDEYFSTLNMKEFESGYD